jgi:hypothetical protein
MNLFPLSPVLLVFRIWRVDRNATRLRGHQKSQLRPILQILIDAGIIYSLTLLVALTTFMSQSNGQYVILDMVRHHASLANENNHTETCLLTTTDRSRPSSPSRFIWLLSVPSWPLGPTRRQVYRSEPPPQIAVKAQNEGAECKSKSRH